jgi:hypothetical protein
MACGSRQLKPRFHPSPKRLEGQESLEAFYDGSALKSTPKHKRARRFDKIRMLSGFVPQTNLKFKKNHPLGQCAVFKEKVTSQVPRKQPALSASISQSVWDMQARSL